MLALTIIAVFVGFLYASMVTAFIVGLIKAGKSSLEFNNHVVPISVVAPLKDEEQNVENLINSITSQDFPIDQFEIILVDDHSSDRTVDIVNRIVQSVQNVKLFHQEEGMSGKKQALALGIANTKHDLVVLTDADCIHSKTWLKAIVSKYIETGASLIIGPVMIYPNSSFFYMIQALEHASLTASTIGASAIGVPFMASSANLAFSKDKLGFKPEMMNLEHPSGDDVFLLHSAKRMMKNIESVNHSMSLVKTKPASTISDFIQQRARWASKAPSYRDNSSIFIASNILVFNLFIVILLFGSFFNPKLWVLFLSLFVLKLIVDLPFLLIFLNRYNRKSLLIVYLPLQLLYPIYILVVTFVSKFIKTKWKGSIVNS